MKKQMTMLVCVAALLIMAGCGKKDQITNNYYQETSPKWTLVNSVGNAGNYISSLAVSGSYLLAGTDRGIYRSPDNGATWTAVDTLLSDATAFAVIGNDIFAFSQYGGQLHHSSDNGATWTPTGLPDTIAVMALAVSNQNIFAGVHYYNSSLGDVYGVYRSSDNGATWTSTGLPDTIEVMALAASGSYLLAGTYFGGTYRSSDNGASWSAIDTSLIYVTGFVMNGTTIFAYTSSTHGLYRSTDNGTTWTLTSVGEPVRAVAVNGNNLFASGSLSGTILSTDNGATWTPLGMNGSTLAANSDYLFTGKYSEIWRLPLAGL
jgi:hypothetical protein